MSTIQKYLYAIRQKLGSIKTDIELCKQLDHDINYKALEETVRRLLNLIYGYNLINLNRLQKNYPAIDLGDSNAELPDGKKGIAVQVTSTTSREKVRHTIHRFEIYELYKQYNRLVVFVTGDKEEFPKDFYSENLEFSKENDIWDFGTLMTEIECIADRNPNKLRKIYEFLEHRTAFDSENYLNYLKACNAECALVPSPDVEFVRDSTLFQELDVFMAYQWLDKLLKEITYTRQKNVQNAISGKCIDMSAPMEEIVKAVTSWVDSHQNDFNMNKKEIDDLTGKIRNIPYLNCLFIMGHYGSGKTRLVTEAALNVWQRDSGEEKPVFVFVKPNDPANLENSMKASFARLLGEGEDLQTYLDAFANHPLIIVMDDIHEYFQNDITLKNLVGMIKRLSRPNIKWILLSQTGYASDPCDLYSDDFKKYAHKWSDALQDVSVKQWLQLDTWYRKVDIPWKILQRAEGIPSGKWVSKKLIASTSYYDPLLANVLIIHAHKKQDWSFLSFENLLFPDICQMYYWLLSQDKPSVKDKAVRVADYFWNNHSLHLVLQKSQFAPKDSDILFNHGLLLLEDNNELIYHGTPDIVWYYLLAGMLNKIKREKEADIIDRLRVEYWKDNPEAFNSILSLWVLEEHQSEKEATGVWAMLMRYGFASVALDSGMKCHKNLRNKLIKIALGDKKAIRKNFHLFLDLCALGVADTETLYGVIDYCVRNCSDEILKYGELFSYMLRQNYAAMTRTEVLGMLSHLSPLAADNKHTDTLCRCGEDIGKCVALKVAKLSQLKQMIDDSYKVCNSRESNKFEKAPDDTRGEKFPAGLFDGFCSAFCNTVIQKYSIEGYKEFRNCEWYCFGGESSNNKKKSGFGRPKINENQRRRNKALTFALAYTYRNAAQDAGYAKWYETLVRKMSDGGIENKTFAFYLIKHTGLREYGYRLPSKSPLLEIAKKLVREGTIRKIVKKPETDAFCNWLAKQ